jgi:hypothetical protein
MRETVIKKIDEALIMLNKPALVIFLNLILEMNVQRFLLT